MSQLTLPTTETHVCVDCGKTIVPSGITTGFGHRQPNNVLGKVAGTVCFDCYGKDDEAVLRLTGRSDCLPLYLSKDENGYYVSNWPGTLRYRVRAFKEGRHNIAARRIDLWYKDSDNALWWGVCYGKDTQIVHCRRIKK